MEENRICYPSNTLGTIMQYNANTCKKCPDNKKCYEIYLRWSLQKANKNK